MLDAAPPWPVERKHAVAAHNVYQTLLADGVDTETAVVALTIVLYQIIKSTVSAKHRLGYAQERIGRLMAAIDDITDADA